jgi:Domain of unknown function (DUF4166)
MMQTIRGSPIALYRQLLGASWDELGEAVRRLHGEEETVRAAGVFRVWHGSNRLARMLVWLGGLPAAGESVDTQLTVAPRELGEEWKRTFAGRPMTSFQWGRPDGLLAERMGPLELCFRLEVCGGALVYHSAGAALRLGPLVFPLPRWCAPRISARETPLDGRDRTLVSVEARAPLLGLMIAYEGTVTRIEA